MSRRQCERIELVRYWKVICIRTGKVFGYLGNISSAGALVYSHQPIDMEGRPELPMTVIPPQPFDGPISIMARKAWHSYDPSLKLHCTGFEFEDVSQAMRRDIDEVIMRFTCQSPAPRPTKGSAPLSAEDYQWAVAGGLLKE